MGFGLILSGLGKGISDAGTTMMAGKLEEEKEKRLMARTIALEEIKANNTEARAEKQRLKNVSDIEAAGKLADEMAVQRGEQKRTLDAAAQKREDEEIASAAGKVVQNNEGAGTVKNTKTGKPIEQSPAASKEEIEALMKANPQANELYAQAGLINRSAMRTPEAEQRTVDPRLQRAKDEYDAALKLGSHSTVLEGIAKKRTDLLAEIRLENSEKKTDADIKIREAAEEGREDRFNRMFPLLAQKADAATTSANKPSGGSANPEKAVSSKAKDQANAAEDALAFELGASKQDIPLKLKLLEKEAAAGNKAAKDKLESVQPIIDKLKEANDQLMNLPAKKLEEKTPPPVEKPGANPGATPKPGVTTKPGAKPEATPKRGVWNPATNKVEWK